MNDIENDIRNLKEEQIKLLILPSEYTKTSGNEIDKLVYKIYEDVKENMLFSLKSL